MLKCQRRQPKRHSSSTNHSKQHKPTPHPAQPRSISAISTAPLYNASLQRTQRTSKTPNNTAHSQHSKPLRSSIRHFSSNSSTNPPPIQLLSENPIHITLAPPSLIPAEDGRAVQTPSPSLSRPNPTDQKLDYLNKRIHTVQRYSIDPNKISTLIPDLNQADNSNDFFDFTTPFHQPFDAKSTGLLPTEHTHMPKSRLESIAREKAAHFENFHDSSINSHQALTSSPTHVPSSDSEKSEIPDQNAQNDGNDVKSTSPYKSRLDQLFRYEDQDDSFLYQAVDPFQAKREQKQRNQSRRENTSQNRSRPREVEADLVEKQRLLGERAAKDVNLDEMNQDVANKLLQTQALAAYVMQNKANQAPPGARPVFWHGTLPYGPNSALLPGLDNLKQETPDLDWRTFLDLSQPHLWYPTARLLKRKIVFHTGPTNSGKTHRAMMRLKEAASGLYCGPLRLLAWENYEKLNAQGVPCSLLTGQEVVEIPKAQHVSSTVEMVSLDRVVDVAVIDEIQMIQDRDRGFAWTRALLGIPAKEIHLAGDATALQWLQQITAMTGEELHICKYDRLSPLSVENRTVNGFKYLRKGDCVVAFSRKDVYSIKKKIETETGKKCAIIYGNLPPDIRKQQAQLFNQGELDFLVASDAIGMGINLNIGRVIFSTIVKYDGQQFRRLLQTEVLQIAGRAGRFNTQFHTGYVNVLHVPEDLEYVREQFKTPLPPMEKAQLFPSTEHLLAFCEKFPTIKLSNYLMALPTRATTSKLFEIAEATGLTQIAEAIDEIEMPAYNRVMLCYAPLSLSRYTTHPVLLKQLAEELVQDNPVAIPKVAYASRPVVPKTPNDVALLEETFSNLEAYIWLWYRMGDQLFMHRQAKLDRESCQRIILHYLNNS